MKYLSYALIIIGLLILAYLGIGMIYAYSEIGALVIFAVLDPIFAIYLLVAAILIGIGLGLKDKLKAKQDGFKI